MHNTPKFQCKMKTIISIRGGMAGRPEWRLSEKADFELNENEHIAIVGPNGGGKTFLAEMITMTHPMYGPVSTYDFSPSEKPLISDNIKYLTFRDSYGTADSEYFLQQRWNADTVDPDMPTIRQLLDKAYEISGPDTAERRAMRDHLYGMFQIEPLLDSQIIKLSSGELRKFQIIKILVYNPRVLVMDNPFLGLDAEARGYLLGILDTLAASGWTRMILVMPDCEQTLPSFITHVIEVKDLVAGKKVPVSEYRPSNTVKSLTMTMKDSILALPSEAPETPEDVVVIKFATVRYGDRKILDGVSWKIRSGEKWALEGRNGSGKSTLLSLICADHPQRYANDIKIFGLGRRASIWDIKRRIGYVSPEMHRAFQDDIPAIMIVASGLQDTLGPVSTIDRQEAAVSRFWLKVFGIGALEDRTFMELSSGEQRLVLLARAFVKDPDLLILDEPLHGLDLSNRERVKEIIRTFCRRPGKTLIMVSHYREDFPECITDWKRLG